MRYATGLPASGASSAARCRRGLSLVEVLISLAVVALLLTAIAAAYAAACSGIELNDRFFRATQAGRVSLNRILTESRQSIDAEAIDSERLEVTRLDGSKQAYWFDHATRRLMVTDNSVPLQPVDRVLASNVESVAFDDADGTVTVRLTVAIDTSRITLSGSAMPRRNVVYR